MTQNQPDQPDQTVLITGASSGIGAACARIFAAAGARLILTARRLERLEALAAELKQQFQTSSHLLPCDVSDQAAVTTALETLPPDWSTIDVLINNAGLSRGLEKLHQGSLSDWEEMIDTNLKGLLYVTRAVLPGMVSRNRGHIVNIGSIAGHQTYPGGNVYCATKAAVRALSEGLKMDLLGTALRVSSIDPGMVETEFSEVRFHGDRERASSVYQGITPLTPHDIAEIVLFCVSRPAHVNISDLIVLATAQASATMVHRSS
ncbi:MAG: SDR family oxidoreductase [Pegethrix bostrychoides GSE-TBD4-15B]|jgi:serine 3-dehydrogenase|uniref:SDR family oxidoreductase n=1 Tax=Pegethrix bostrychoides GSE-TBD4-15B TaxID=2839662 RepID=A0A951U846_9CYAN|nr:SDR family oxidoreductase [Pegethrix bostrychoides GSE-TBD4-15B]